MLSAKGQHSDSPPKRAMTGRTHWGGPPPFLKKKENFRFFFMINCFLGNFGWTSFSSVISTNFAIQGENITKNFDITNMKIIHKSVFLLPCPQSQNNTSTKLDPNEWSYLIFGEYSVLWLEKKKIGESFKVQFGEKNPNNGKNRQSFKTAKLEKEQHCCKHIHNSFFFPQIFALCLQNKFEIWRFLFFLV